MFTLRRVTQCTLLGMTLSFTATAANAGSYPVELEKGLIDVCTVQPEDPVDYLAEWLFKHGAEGVSSD